MLGVLTRSIPRRILASLIGIYIVTYVATSLVVYSGARTSMLEFNAAALNQLADLKYQQLADAIGGLATDLTAWSELEVMNDLVSGDVDMRVDQTLEGLKRLYNLTGEIYAFDAAGKLLASSLSDDLEGRVATLPPQWRSANRQLVFLDKQADPIVGTEIVALEIPVFASFDRNYRIGTLVMTHPWATIEKHLFSGESGTILVERGDAADRVLAADRRDYGRIRLDNGTESPGFVVGWSRSSSAFIGNWQVVTWRASGSVFRPLRQVALELLLLGLFLGVPIAILGRWLSHRLTAPIAQLTRTVREIADTDRLDARVPISSSDELGTLARSFNRMTHNLERASREREQYLQELGALNLSLEAKIAARTVELEKAIAAQQRLIGDISHEIKSPLARLSVALGLARRVTADAPRQFERMEREIENISALARELLTLARLDGIAGSLEFAAIDLWDLVEQVVTDAIYETPGRSADVVLRKPDVAITVDGNADLLRRAIENVIRNAMFYTAAKTQVEVVVRRKSPDWVAIEVWDRGPGVPAEALAHLFEPFYRVDEARTRETGGTGIGLAICQRAVHLHGGIVRARNNDPHGLIVEIELPIARQT